MYLAQYECYGYCTNKYARDDPHNIHQYHPMCQKLMPICIKHNTASAISTPSSMFIIQSNIAMPIFPGVLLPRSMR